MRVKYVILSLCCLFASQAFSQDKSYEEQAVADEIKMFYSHMANLLYADKHSEKEFYNHKNVIKAKTVKGENYMNDFDFGFSPNLIRSNIDSYIAHFVQLMNAQFRQFDDLLVSFKQKDMKVNLLNKDIYRVSFKNTLRVLKGDELEEIMTDRKVTFIIELAKKSENNRILEIAYELPKPEPSPVNTVTNSKQNVQQAGQIQYGYDLRLTDGNVIINELDLDADWYRGVFDLKAYVKKTSKGVSLGQEAFSPTIKLSDPWIGVKYDGFSREFLLTAQKNSGKHSRYGSVLFLNDSGRVVKQLSVRQHKARKYEFPSFLSLNGDDEYLGVSLVYQPKAEFGIQGMYQSERWFIGGEYRAGAKYFPAAYNNNVERSKNTHNVGKDYLYHTGPGFISQYNPVYDPYNEAKVDYSYMEFGVLGGLMLNDILALEAGISYINQLKIVEMPNAYNIAVVAQPDNTYKYEYEKTPYSLKFDPESKHGLGTHLGLNGYIHIKEWERILKIGAGYRYSPNFEEYNNFYVSIGWVWSIDL